MEQLEDEVFDFGDDKKGSLIFSAAATNCKCPECGKLMKRFEYRAYDLEMDFVKMDTAIGWMRMEIKESWNS